MKLIVVNFEKINTDKIYIIAIEKYYSITLYQKINVWVHFMIEEYVSLYAHCFRKIIS